MEKAINIFIVDDHDLFREGVKFVLTKNKHFQVSGEASNGTEFIKSIENHKPDIVLMDIDMPVMNGFEATRQALEMYPDLSIITLSMHGDQGHYQRMTELGVKGFILKDTGSKPLQLAIEEVYNGRNYFSQELLMKIIIKNEQEPHGRNLAQELDISERELDVLRLICKARTNKQIADELFISPKTVEGHKARLMQKTGSNNSVALVLFAIKNHLIEI